MSAPLVLLPGIDGQRHVWDRVVKEMVERHCCSIVLPKGDLKAAAKVLLSEVSAAQFFLAGTSYGGLVARAVAELAPSRVKGVCMIGTLPHRKFCPPQIPWTVRTLRRTPTPIFSFLYRQRLRQILRKEGFSPSEVQVFSQLVSSKEDYLERLQAVLDWDLADRINVPALLLRGMHDSEAPWTLESAKQALLGVDVRSIPGGHRAIWTHPHHVVNTLEEWMAEVRDGV